jgi:hypothetical protein
MTLQEINYIENFGGDLVLTRMHGWATIGRTCGSFWERPNT